MKKFTNSPIRVPRSFAAVLLLAAIVASLGAPASGQGRAQPSGGEAVSVSGTLSLDDLVQVAIRDNHEIRAAQKKYEASLSRRSVVSSLPDPRLSLASINAGNPLPGSTLGSQDMSQLGFEFMQELPAPGKLQLEGRMAQKEADSDSHAYRQVQLRVVSELKQAFYRWHFVRQALDVVEKDNDLLQKFEKIAEARYSIGQGVQQDILRAQVELSALIKKRVAFEREEGSLIAKINTLLDRPPDSPLASPREYAKTSLPASSCSIFTPRP